VRNWRNYTHAPKPLIKGRQKLLASTTEPRK